MAKQIEYGRGDVWKFEVTSNITSGQVVQMSGTESGMVRPCNDASAHVIGIALTPASAGEWVGVVMDGVIEVYVTGVGSVVAGDLFGGGVGGRASERAWSDGNECRYNLGYAIEAGARNGQIRMRLTP